MESVIINGVRYSPEKGYPVMTDQSAWLVSEMLCGFFWTKVNYPEWEKKNSWLVACDRAGEAWAKRMEGKNREYRGLRKVA